MHSHNLNRNFSKGIVRVVLVWACKAWDTHSIHSIRILHSHRRGGNLLRRRRGHHLWIKGREGMGMGMRRGRRRDKGREEGREEGILGVG